MHNLSFVCIILKVILLQSSLSQNNNNGCSNYLRNVHRMGPNVQGRLEIPTDELFPKYKLKIGFSSPIHHLTVRQSRAKDTGTHREFVVDPMEMKKDGKLQLDIFIRLQRLLGPIPRMTRIVYNNEALCGDPLDPSEVDDSLTVELTTNAPPRSTWRTWVPHLTVTNNPHVSKNKEDVEEEEDIF